MEPKKNSQQFSSIIGFLLVTIGFAVGVGSLWRFPYVVGANGGAVFLIVYLLLVLIIGVPLLTAEISIGYSTKKTAIKAYKELAPKKPWYMASYLHIAAAICIVSYTIPVYAWILNYLFNTATGTFSQMSSAAEIQTYFETLTGNKQEIFLFAVLNWALLIAVLSGGLQGGVEKISKLLMPLLAIIMAIIIFVGLSLPNSGEGLLFLLQPDFSKFTVKSLLDALGQAFFAIGIGMLASMIFGSYIKKDNENIMKNSNIICFAIIFAGIAAGFMIFPIVFSFGLSPTGGPGLTFITLPNSFNQMGNGSIVGTLFYLGFYIAAFTSALGVIEAVVGLFMSEFNISRKKAIFVAMTIIMCLGSATILIDPLFDFLDILTSNYLIVIGTFIISIFTGWVWGIDNFIKAANVKNPIMQLWLKISVKYISPIVILVVFVSYFIAG